MASENERSSSTNNSHHQQQLQQQHYQQPLHLTLFEAGVASRRESLNLLRSNRIRINDVPIRDLARTDVQLRNFTVDFLNSLISSGMLSPGNFSSCSKANPCSETNNAITSFRDVTITMVDNDNNNNDDKNKNSQTLQIIDTTPETHRYLLLHKPRGILCSCSPENRSWATSSKKRKLTSLQPPRSHCDNDRENDNVRNDRSSSNDYVSPPLITSLVPPHIKERLGYVGRLDLDSEGLVFMTNDHSLMDGLLIPRKVDGGGVGAGSVSDGVDGGGGGRGCGKVYEIVVLGRPEEKDVEELRKGKKIGNMGKLLPCRIEFLDWFESIRRGSGSPGDSGIENDGVSGEQGDGVGMLHRPYDDNFDNIAEDIRGYSKFRVTLWEGKKNQIRRMFGSIGHRVIRLVRVSFGPLRLGTLPVGGWRYLTEEEITKLKRCCDGKLRLETGESKT